MPLVVSNIKLKMKLILFFFERRYTLFDLVLIAAFVAAMERNSLWAALPFVLWFFAPTYEGDTDD